MKSVIVQYIESYNKAHPEFNYKNSLSVSKCIEFLTHEFDAEAIANEMVQKYYNKEGHKYYHMTAPEIIQMWENKRNMAIAKGKLFDSYVEQIIEIKDPKKFNEWKIIEGIEYNEFMQIAMVGFKNIIHFLKDSGYSIIIGTEIPLWIKHPENPELIVNGRCDCLMYNPTTKKYLIIDWKTNEEIKVSGFKNMKGPLSNLAECEFNKYITQLSFYKKALSETYALIDFDNIDIIICQMGIKNSPHYRIYKPNLLYDNNLMNNIIKYCHSVKEILKDKHIN